jgi:hypothetical protein
MKLTFTGQPAVAAATILAGTSLRYLISESGPLRLSDVDNDCGTLDIDDGWRWSSGEKWLNELLYSISLYGDDSRDGGARAYLALGCIEARCDSETARVCREAVALLDAA